MSFSTVFHSYQDNGREIMKEGCIVRNPGRDISFPIFIRKEIETRKLERKSKQKISRSIDLLYRLNDIISR